MWVTCHADASFGRDKSAWAVWLRSSEGRIVKSGALPKLVTDSVTAELAAIYAGVYLAVHSWEGVRGVYVRSDCMPALELAQRGAPRSRKGMTARIQARLDLLVRAFAIDLDCRWVRGHQSKRASTAAFVNNTVDRLARRQRGRART